MKKRLKNQPASYQPSQKVLANYADVLVNFALNSGQGVKKGEVVEVLVPDVAKPLARELQNALLQAGAYPMLRLLPTEFDKDFYTLANEQQLKFFPRKYLKSRVNLIDHRIGIIADPDPWELSQVDPKKIILARDSKKAFRDWLVKKENQGRFTWTVALWGVPAKAKEVGLSPKAYWQEIIKACFLDKKQPIKEWQKVFVLQKKIKAKLNNLEIDYLVVEGPDVNLRVSLGADRIWQGGSGRNIPSFELFTSPDWRRVEGQIHFNQPLYRYGNVIQNITMRLVKGRVVEAKAAKGNQFLQEMLKSKNADKIGEFSLTDKRMSRITHPMAETLYDENIGGPFGNTHLAVGMSYHDCYRGDASKMTKREWRQRGFNDAAEHTDIVSTTDRTVMAHLTNGKKKLIYKKGQFVF